MGMDLSELNDMYSKDTKVRAEWMKNLPITIKRGECDELFLKGWEACKKEVLEILNKELLNTNHSWATNIVSALQKIKEL